MKAWAIWTIIKLEEDIMVLNNVTKFNKILIKDIRVRERTSSGQTYVITYVGKCVRTYGRTGVALNAPAIIMAGAYTIQQPLKRTWSCLIENSGKFHSA